MKKLKMSLFLSLAALAFLGCGYSPGGDSSFYYDEAQASSNGYDIEYVTVYDIGYQPTGAYCTQQTATLYHEREALCLEANDGCQIGYALDLGFNYDDSETCY